MVSSARAITSDAIAHSDKLHDDGDAQNASRGVSLAPFQRTRDSQPVGLVTEHETMSIDNAAAEVRSSKEATNDESYELLDFDDEMEDAQNGDSPLSSIESSPSTTHSAHEDHVNDRLPAVEQVKTPSKRKRTGASAQSTEPIASNEDHGMEDNVLTRRARRVTARSIPVKR